MPAAQPARNYVLRLYNADRRGEMAALAKRFTEALQAHAPGEHRVEVVDVLSEPERAAADQVFVTPTLVKAVPEPVRRVIGDMSDPGQILLLLGVLAVEAEPGDPENA